MSQMYCIYNTLVLLRSWGGTTYVGNAAVWSLHYFCEDPACPRRAQGQRCQTRLRVGGVLGGEASCQRGQGLREGQIAGKAQTTALMKVCGRVLGKRSPQDLLELVKTKRAKRWVCRTPAGRQGHAK